MFALVVRFDLRDEAAAAEFDRLAAEVVPLIDSDEPDTLVYLTHTVEGEPLQRLFYEVYTDRAAHAKHMEYEHTASFLAAKDALITSARVEHLTSPVGKGD